MAPSSAGLACVVPGGGLAARDEVELAHRIWATWLRGVRAQCEFARDQLVAQSTHHQRQHLGLARTERVVEPGGSFDAGERVLRRLRPPIFDGPTSRGLLDPSTGAMWIVDAFACFTPCSLDADDLPQDLLAQCRR